MFFLLQFQAKTKADQPIFLVRVQVHKSDGRGKLSTFSVAIERRRTTRYNFAFQAKFIREGIRFKDQLDNLTQLK
jgi:hypothetical protein